MFESLVHKQKNPGGQFFVRLQQIIIIILPAIIIIIIEMILIVMLSLPPLIMSQLQTLPITSDSIPTTTTSLASPSIFEDNNINNLPALGFHTPIGGILPTTSHGVAPHTPPSDHITTHITPSPSHQLSFRTT